MTDTDPSDFDELLDLGLATAFRTGGDGDEPPLEASALEVERFDDLPPRIGRYETRGLLAQGGMGVIVRAHDPELGREVAIKLLRRRLVEVAALQRMFHQEARVMGQLQHPGIVPVHDVGLTSDGRPYYAMKLVAGSSLQSMIRSELLSAERQQLLAVFARVCETVAYAHSRGIVHGDLTPANIMVGAFGEVQVLDWGFARSAQAFSPNGRGVGEAVPRVLGTPAYMAPEQARGAAEQLDPRADVFGLGGILCALLTGEPPYRGINRDEVFLRAARAWLDDAQGRLSSCGADPQLVSIARACLSIDPAQRPADAGSVATLVHHHLAAVEQRVRSHALEAAQARARADAERAARRRTVALSTLLVASLLIGGGAFVWHERRTAELRSDAEQRASLLLERMVSLRDTARTAVVDRAQRWAETAAVAREVPDVVDATHLGAGLRARLQSVHGEIEAEAQRVQRDERAANLLEDLDPHVGEDRSPVELEAAYRALFDIYGVDVDTADATVAAAALRSSSVSDRLAEALHRWAKHRRLRAGQGSSPAASTWQRLIVLADAVDLDPWRTELRRVWATRDLAAVQAIADRCAYDKVSSESLSFLASCLLELGDRERALQVYRQAHLRHPGDYELVHDLAAELQRGVQPPRAEIFTLMRAALALRPRSPHALIDFATELQAAGDGVSARLLVEQAIELEPRYARAWVVSAVIAEHAGDLPGVVRAAREALRLRPHWVSATLLLADALHRQDLAGEALQVCQQLVAAVPDSARAQRALGTMQNELGYVAEGLDALRASLRLAPNDAETHYHLGLALQAAGHDADALAAYRRAIELQPDYAEAHCNAGSALIAAGRYTEALASLRKGHELGRLRPKWRHPTERWIADVANLEANAEMIEGAARGDSRPTDAESLASLALAVLQAGHAQAAFEMLLEAEALDSALMAPRVRVAVTVAARAASADGDDVVAAARAKARETCRAWIDRALVSVRAGIDRAAISAPMARQLLSRWQLCPELAPMRAADAPDAAVWRKTWAELADLQARLRGMD